MQPMLIAPRLEWHPAMAEAAIKVITVVAIITGLNLHLSIAFPARRDVHALNMPDSS